MLILTFQIGSERIGLDIQTVREVVPRVRLRPLSGGPPWLAGVFVFRGLVVPVIDLHDLTGQGPCPEHLSSRIILVPQADPHTGFERLLGLLTSQVSELRTLSAGFSTISQTLTPGGIGLGMVIADELGILRLLDPEKLLPAADRERLWYPPPEVLR